MRWWSQKDRSNSKGLVQQRRAFDGKSLLVLGGGGARGIAHLGVLEELVHQKVPVARVVGVSMGSLAGAMFAVGGDAVNATEAARAHLASESFQRRGRLLEEGNGEETTTSQGGWLSWHKSLPGFGLLNRLYNTHRLIGRVARGTSLLGDRMLRDAVDALLPDIGIEDTRIPLSVVAADLKSGRTIVMETGSLRSAVRASMSIPGVFPPVSRDDMLLCDVGVVDSLPTRIARSYTADRWIAVDVGADPSSTDKFDSAWEVMMRVEEIGERILRAESTELADLVIRPDVGSVSWSDFGQPERLIDAGRRAARLALRAYRANTAPPTEPPDLSRWRRVS